MTNWREPTYSKAAERFRGKSKDYTLEGDINPQPKLDDKFSFDKAYQDQEAAGYIPYKQYAGAGRDGMVSKEGRKAYYSKDSPDKQAIKSLQSQVKTMQAETAELKKANADGTSKPQPKGDLQIETSSEANKPSEQWKPTKSSWAQAHEKAQSADKSPDIFDDFDNISNASNQAEQAPQKDPQSFADKYKLNLINAGATKQNTIDFSSV